MISANLFIELIFFQNIHLRGGQDDEDVGSIVF